MKTDYHYGIPIMHRRKDLGITQEQLAQQTGISLRTISNIESGLHSVRIGTINRIREALGMTELARRIKAMMALRGINQSQLAEATGQSTQTISKLCNGKADFRFSTMRKIEIALQCTLILIPNEDLV